jgi:hypothetical protein
MTQQEIAAFLQEIGGVCARHKMGCFVGLWFAGKGHDEMGISANHDITDSQMKRLSEFLTQFLTDFQDSIYKGKELHRHRGTTTGQDGENN